MKRLRLTVIVLVAVLAGTVIFAKSTEKKGKSGTNDYNWDNFNYFDDSFLDPFNEMQQMRKDINRMFDDSFERMKEDRAFWMQNDVQDNALKMDMKETKDKVIVKMDVPGADKSSINVNVKGNMLTVTAKRTEEKEQKGKDKEGKFLKKERSMSVYSRKVSLPDKVDSGKVETDYKNGVLTVTIAKK